MMRPRTVSTSSIRPERTRDLRTIFSGGMSSTPTSLERMSMLSSVM